MQDFQSFTNAILPELMKLITAGCEYVMASREPNQLIKRHSEPYISRWMLSRKAAVPVYDDPAWQTLGGTLGFIPSELENLYLHRYDRSDKDDPHCHPWANMTLVVRGYYREHCYESGTNKLIASRIRKVGDVVVRSADSVHAIVETSPDCVSLFGTFKKEKDWGFHTDNGFVHSSQYHNNSASFPG